MRQQRFTFLCNEDERLLIAVLADKLQRSQSDAVRLVVFNAVRELQDQELANTYHTPKSYRGVRCEEV